MRDARRVGFIDDAGHDLHYAAQDAGCGIPASPRSRCSRSRSASAPTPRSSRCSTRSDCALARDAPGRPGHDPDPRPRLPGAATRGRYRRSHLSACSRTSASATDVSQRCGRAVRQTDVDLAARRSNQRTAAELGRGRLLRGPGRRRRRRAHLHHRRRRPRPVPIRWVVLEPRVLAPSFRRPCPGGRGRRRCASTAIR